LAGVNQAHEQVPNMGAILGLIKECILAMQNRFLQPSFAKVIIQWRSRLPQKQRQLWPVISANSSGGVTNSTNDVGVLAVHPIGAVASTIRLSLPYSKRQTFAVGILHIPALVLPPMPTGPRESESVRCVHSASVQSPHVPPCHGDDWDINIRVNILRSLNGSPSAEQKDQKRQHHDGVGAPQRKSDHPHLTFTPPARHGR